MSDFDDRLRTALTDLGRTAEDQVRPAGPAGVPTAGRRRRAVQAATGVLVLVLAGGTTATAARLTYDESDAASPTASATCAPTSGEVFLDKDAPPEIRQKLEAILAGPEFTSAEFGGKVGGIMYWSFTLRCADDLPAVKERIEAVPVTALTWAGPPPPGDPSESSTPAGTLSPKPPPGPPMQVCDSNGCTPFTPSWSGSASHR